MSQALRGTFLDNFGRPIPDVSISVKKAGTATDATIYSDETLITAIGNPATSEADGSYLLYAPNGRYDIIPTKIGYTFDPTDSVNEVIFDDEIITSISASHTMTDKDVVILADASSGAITISLQALSAVKTGRKLYVLKIDATANVVTIDPNGAETISGSATFDLTVAKQGYIIMKGATEWYILSRVPLFSETGTAGYAPLGTTAGVLDNTWGGSASSLATLDASTKVVQDPANATVTPTASKIPIADASGKLAAGWGGNASTLATLDAGTRLVEAANKLSDGTNTIHVKIISIGDWNMDAVAAVSVAHGLTDAKIRSVSASIIMDTSNSYYNLLAAVSSTSGAIAWAAGDIILGRVTSGYFDTLDFDATSFNRGYITIWYVE